MRGFNVQLPKRKWTPQWLAITTMMLLIFTVAFANGTYMGSTIVLTGTLGTTTEDIMMSFYAGTLGIVAANPLQQKIRLALTPKTLIISDLILQVFLSIVCGHSESILIITICSFFSRNAENHSHNTVHSPHERFFQSRQCAQRVSELVFPDNFRYGAVIHVVYGMVGL